MRYFPTLLRQLKNCAADPATDQLTGFQFNYLANQLESEQCKRLIFDARQAKVFDESSEIDERRRDKIHPPFRHFYLELTEPVLLKAQEPGCSDVLWAVLFQTGVAPGIEVINKGTDRRKVMVTKVTFFYRSNDDVQFVDRTWSMAPEGYPLVGRAPVHVTKRYKHQQGIGASASGLVNPELLPEYVKDNELISIFELSEYGWWEETLIANSNLLYWMFAYTMAKSVEIVEVPVSRQMRRAAAREGRIPNPWHLVRVEPKRVKGKIEYVGESGTKHSYRYDVIGHLRFNRHLTKEGYKDTIEWVADHQRGLENELYIPKTYKVEKDKKIALPEMKEYFEQGES
jgi:hypothetical protein